MRGAFETVAVHVAGEVADEPGVLHAEGGGGELGIQVGDELGDPGLPAQPGGPCAGSSPAAAWPCPETKNSAAPRHAAATTSTPSRPAWPPQ
jgi:hypothetical protein